MPARCPAATPIGRHRDAGLDTDDDNEDAGAPDQEPVKTTV